ncbi:hypothetical protein ACH5RR_013076 [Cinchona calisaya]|uniref:Uncharacterized protein n=1 Tax=Cinchona calisaya TaxID=153742 RepID=A0ABD3A0B3_9GENT
MDKVRGLIPAIIFFFSLALSLGIVSATEDHNAQNTVQEMHEEPSAKGLVQNSYFLLTKSSKMYWEGIKSVFNQLQISLFPPDIESISAPSANSHAEGHNVAGAKMKEAAEKSFQTTKVAVEESAKSAAKVVGEAVHKTTEKVKERTSVPHDSPAEL